MVDELLRYFGWLYFERSVRIVALSGSGKAFFAGLDLKGDSSFAADPSIGSFAFHLSLPHRHPNEPEFSAEGGIDAEV
jgi:enoyl-CoA hydratase/carnithine racemase